MSRQTPAGSSAEPPNQTPSALWRLAGYARPYLGLIGLAVLLAVTLSAGHYGRAYLIKPIFDDVLGPSAALRDAGETLSFGLGELLPGGSPEPGPGAGDEPAGATRGEATPASSEAEDRERLRSSVGDSLSTIVLAIAIILVVMPLSMFAREYTVQWVLGRIDLDLKVDLCSRLLALPLRFHQERNRGDLFSRLMEDVRRSHQALNLLFGDFVESLVMLAVGAAALVFVSWKLSLVMLLVGPALFATISIFGRRIRKSARRRQEQFADVTSRLVEILEGIKVIKAFRAENTESEGFARAAEKLFRRGMRVVMNRVMARSLVDGMNNVAAIGVLLLGVFLILGGHWGLTLGDLAAFTAIAMTTYRPVRTLARGWVKLMDAQPSAERFFDVLDSPVEIADAKDAKSIPRLERGIRFREVSFSYGREPVLHRVDLEVGAGQMLAIVGPTGAGKTTLVDLLLRFYDPTGGSIEIDGVDLRRVRRDDLLDQMAVVSQDPFLFDGSIEENIRYGRPDASGEELRAAARAAHVEEFVSELAQGYDTEVGAGGARLSGGQRQRVTIARAILRDPAILVLDEATSSLDSKSERLVQDAIQKLLPGRTAFVIAHRLSTVRAADQIAVIESGRVVQLGGHDELAAQPGLYRELVELQDTTSGNQSEA